ncbi:MAG: hypothetical protein KKF37_04685 [Proteobacteria bacterium]|nr:hypothetical protein [Pseudomonadota bacterium]
MADPEKEKKRTLATDILFMGTPSIRERENKLDPTALHPSLQTTFILQWQRQKVADKETRGKALADSPDIFPSK